MQFVDVSRMLREIRMIKSAYEIGLIRQAAIIQDHMARRLREVVRPGMTELELAAEVEAEARRHGHQGFVRVRRFGQEFYYGHLLCGPSGEIPSWLDAATGGTGLSPAFGTGPGWRQIQPHEPILLDYAGVYCGYHSDQTRLFALGALPEALTRAYEACLAIREEILAVLCPGTTTGHVFRRAQALADRLGYADRFMGLGADRVHFVGHGVGIELDELPVLAAGGEATLEGGMTVAVEPKIVCPGLGVVGVEDTFLITDGEPECLTVTGREMAVL